MASPSEILKSYWGYDSFRAPQEAIIQSVLDGQDTFVLLPTGGGKSVCFQVPALAQEGICIVISPLIALMQDQVSQLRQRGISAETIHSGLHKKEIDRTLDNCVHGNVKFLYLAPERLRTEIFIERLKQMKVNLVAIDESHCVSQWGHDFRPSYLKIAEIRAFLPDVPFMALTATATDTVRQDIIDFLELKNHSEFSKSFARDNIRFVVRKTLDKRAKIVEICQKINGSAIVYADTRKHTKDYCELLLQHGISASFYHAGLESEKKAQLQEEWISGQTRVICATNAFGMGIDKPDVRLVIHPHIPAEPEAFYQEAGRAGRDGNTSISVIVYNDSDFETLDRNLALKYPDHSSVKRIYSLLYQEYQIAFGSGEEFSTTFDMRGFALKHGIHISTLHYALKILEKADFIALQNYGRESSKLMFKISHTEVYKFQVANPNLDDLLTVIIRSYGGTFEHLVPIDERALAQRAKLTLPVLHNYLQNLAERNIITYQQKTHLPTLTFLHGRVQEDYLTIPHEVYSVRKVKDQARVDAMKSFVTRRKCRMNALLVYFDEKRTEPCGTCDVCSQLTKMGLSQKQFDNIITGIKIALKTQPLSPAEIPAKLTKFSPEKIAEVLKWMVDNELVSLNKEEKYEVSVTDESAG